MDTTTPQLEDGYIRIATEIAKYLAKTYMSSYESQVLWAIFIKTYGYNKKSDWISNSQFVELTGIKKPHVSRTIKKLLQRKIVTQTGNKISFQKNSSMWRELPKQVTILKKLPEQVQLLPKQVQPLPKQVTTINNNTIDKHTKDRGTAGGKDSKHGRTACTEEEILFIAKKLSVPVDAVRRTHSIIMNKIETGEFKNKTVYHSLENWILMDIGRGNIRRVQQGGLLPGYKLIK